MGRGGLSWLLSFRARSEGPRWVKTSRVLVGELTASLINDGRPKNGNGGCVL